MVKVNNKAFRALMMAGLMSTIFSVPAAHAGAPTENALQVLVIAGADQKFQNGKQRLRLAQSAGRRVSPSAALLAAVRAWPGSKGLGVRYLPGRGGYLVTLKTRGRVHRVFVDARSGRVGR